MYDPQVFMKVLKTNDINVNFIKKYRVLIPNEVPIDTDGVEDKFKIIVATKLNDPKPLDLSYYQLYHFVRFVYRNSDTFKRGLTFYEYFNADNFDVKPRLDIDKKLYNMFHPRTGQNIVVSEDMQDPAVLEEYVKTVLNNIYTILKSLFPDFEKEDYAIAKDCRWMRDKNEVPYYKISYHVVLWKKKVNSKIFKKYIESNLDKFRAFELQDAIDLSIYKGGLTKWRIPMCKKYDVDQNKDNSLLVPLNNIDYEDFHKHIITYTVNCEELELVIENDTESINTEEDISYNTDAKDFISRIEDNNKEIDAIKKKYTYIGVPKYENSIEYIDVLEYECGQDHNNNHNYLIHDTNRATLKIKCHSTKCSNFSKILYQPKNNYNDFNVNYFNNIPILEDKEDNYNHCKEYFEHFFKFMRDSNSFYRIDNTYDKRLKYFDRKVKPVKIEGYTDLLYKKKIDGEIKPEKFIEKYKNDPNKKSYFDLTFEPYSKEHDNEPIEDNNFNLFNGFNYETILTYDEKQEIDETKYADFKFLLEHIKEYHCSNNDQHFDFLMQFLANIIQKPQSIPQIILIFYSHSHGTGKSQFTRFIAEVIGNGLSFFGSLKQITETHTNAHIGKLINIVEEVDKYSTRTYENIIKDYSQRSYAPYNEKNKQIIQIKTFVRYFFTTNHIDGVHFDNEDRRYCLYTFEKIYDKNHIDRIQNILKDNVIKYLFGCYLSKYEIKYHNPNHWNENRYKTPEYYNMMVEDSLKSFIKQIYFGEYINIDEEDSKDLKLDEEEKQCLFIHPNRFKTLFQEFCNDNGERKPKMMDVYKKMSTTYKEFIDSKVRVGRRKMYRFDLFKLGKFLNQPEDKIMNHYNKYRLVEIVEDIDEN